jgi:AraC-like DNA-binding protein
MTRAEKAKQLLRTGCRVEEAALETGFYDSSHFYRIFRKMSGISPLSYRLCKGQYCTGLDKQ